MAVKSTMKPTPATCHPEKANKVGGRCNACYEKYLEDKNPEYKARKKANQKAWRQANLERRKETREKWIATKDPEYDRRCWLMSRHSITLETYNEMLENQHGVCNICKKPPKENKNLAVDHCHETGVIRGLLCFRCNFGLSYFSEMVDILENAVEHLKSVAHVPEKPIKTRTD